MQRRSARRRWLDGEELVALVLNDADEVIAEGMVSRPAPNRLEVVLPRELMSIARFYLYTLVTIQDTDGDGEIYEDEVATSRTPTSPTASVMT